MHKDCCQHTCLSPVGAGQLSSFQAVVQATILISESVMEERLAEVSHHLKLTSKEVAPTVGCLLANVS